MSEVFEFNFGARKMRPYSLSSVDFFFLFEPFWDSDNPGFEFLWSNDASYKESDWVKSIFGFDGVLKQPNILLGFIYGQAAR